MVIFFLEKFKTRNVVLEQQSRFYILAHKVVSQVSGHISTTADDGL